jgi:hypothetical protein
MKTVSMKLARELRAAAAKMQDHYTTGRGWYSGQDEEGNDVWNHWSGALGELKASTGMERLPESWVTILTLSLAYGPTPTLDRELTDDEASCVVAAIWPNGNNCGCSISPEVLISELEEMGLLGESQ